MKLTTERLKRLIREELSKMSEADRKKLPFDLLTHGAMGYVRNQMRPDPKKKKEEPSGHTLKKRPYRPLDQSDYDQVLKSKKKEPVATPHEVARELKNSNLIANVLDGSTVRVKLKDASGKYINKDFNVDQFQTSQEIIDQIQKEFPSAMMQASQKGMRKGDMVDIGDPMMERKNKRRNKNA